MPSPRILVVKLSSLGDILHVLPTVHALRGQLGAEIHWAVQPEYAELVHCFPDVSRVITVPRRPWRRGLAAAVSALRTERYDMVVDLQGLLKSAWVSRLARAPMRLGPSFAREGSRLFYTACAGGRQKGRHAVEEAQDVLDYLGLQRPGEATAPLQHPSVALPGPRPRIGFLPVSRWPTKNWPAEHFGELARRIGEAVGGSVYVLGGGGDAAVGERIRRHAPETVLNLCGQHRLPALFGVLRELDLVVADDTGPVHMAAALGLPCLVLFGPTSPELTGPYGPGHRMLRQALPCQPCFSRRCRVGGLPCLAGISPATVLASVTEMLASGAGENV